MNSIKIAFWTCIITGLFSCKSVSTLSEKEILDLASKSFGKDVQIVKNETLSYALCYSTEKQTLLNPGNALHYGIMDLSKEIIIYQENIHHGEVSWYNNTTVLVKVVSEVYSDDETSSKYYLDIETLKKDHQPTD